MTAGTGDAAGSPPHGDRESGARLQVVGARHAQSRQLLGDLPVDVRLQLQGVAPPTPSDDQETRRSDHVERFRDQELLIGSSSEVSLPDSSPAPEGWREPPGWRSPPVGRGPP